MTVLPRFIQDMPEGEAREQATQRFVLRLAALYASVEGTSAELSQQLGISKAMMMYLLGGQKRISPELSIAIEKQVGREVVQRELLRADLFVIED